jgi:hypothetical protein
MQATLGHALAVLKGILRLGPIGGHTMWDKGRAASLLPPSLRSSKNITCLPDFGALQAHFRCATASLAAAQPQNDAALRSASAS